MSKIESKLYGGFMKLLLLLTLFFSVCSWAKNPVVVMDTSMGSLEIELNEEKAPITVKNFLRYVNEKHYDGTIFHRVIKGFMIQAGGHTPDMKEKKTHAPIQNESKNGLINDIGTIAMARLPDPHTASAQFYINVNKNDTLNAGANGQEWGYAVFGKVIKGMDIVKRIEMVRTGSMLGYNDVPMDTVLIKTVKVK